MRKKWLGSAAAIAGALAIYIGTRRGETDMKMTAIEKLFVNRPGHGESVARRGVELLDHTGVGSGARYLDAGCGVGTAARRIAEIRGLDVTGIDIDPDQIRIASSGALRQNLRFAVMDATRMQFADGEFDVVATSMVMHHVPGWEKALAEMVRVLKSGGYLIFTDLIVPDWAARFGAVSPGALQAAAARGQLTEIHRENGLARVSVVWKKR